MTMYKLCLWQNGRLMGDFVSETPWAAEAMELIRQRFPTDEGFSTAVWVAHHEKRVLETTLDGVRLISREPVFETPQAAAS